MISTEGDQNYIYKKGLPSYSYEKLKNRKDAFTSLTDETEKFNLEVYHKENPFIEFNRESLIPHMTSSEGPALAVGDLNADGLDDFYLGSSKREISKVYLQQKNGKFELKPSEVFHRDSTHEEVDVLMIDVDLSLIHI